MKKLFALIFLMLFLSLTTACDLGYDNYEAYGDAFKVNFIDSDRNKYFSDDGVSINEFYNEESTKNFTTKVENDAYKYVVIKPTEDVTISKIYFYCMSETEMKLTFNLFVVDSLPSKFGNFQNVIDSFSDFLSDPDQGFEFVYNDEPSKNILSSDSGTGSTKFTDFGFTGFTSNNEFVDTIKVESDQYLLIQIANNCDTGLVFTRDMTLQDVKDAIALKRAQECTINITDIMIRVENE